MIKEEIRSTIKNLLPKIDKTNKYHPRVIDACIEKVLSEMYVELWMISPRQLDAFCKTYTNIAVTTENSSGIAYSVVPVQIVHIPDKASGIRHIYTLAQTGNLFHPMDAFEADSLYNSDIAVISNKIGYRVKQQDTTVYPRVDYWNMNATVQANGVRMEVLPVFSAYVDTDIVLVPEIKNKQGLSFTDRVLTMLSAIPPVDTKDDNKESQSHQAQTAKQ